MPAWLELTRPVNVIAGGITCYLGGYMVGIDGATHIPLLFSCFSVMLLMAAGNIVNDVIDSAIDSRAHPYRPIPSGRVDRSIAKGMGIGFWIASMLSMLIATRLLYQEEWLWWAAPAIWLLAASLMATYDLGPRSKNRGILGNIAISLMVGAVILFGAAAVGSIDSQLIWFVGLTAFFINLGREMVKDCEDMDADGGRQTMPMRVGRENTRMVAYLCALAGLVMSAIPYYTGLLDIQWLLLQAPAFILILTCNKPLMTGDDRKAQRSLRIGLFFGLIGFVAASALS